MDMTLGSRDFERQQLNWTHVQKVVSSFLAKRVSLTKTANLLSSHGKPRESNRHNWEKNYSAFKINYLRSNQTTKKHMTLGPRNFERRQINWNHVHRVL